MWQKYEICQPLLEGQINDFFHELHQTPLNKHNQQFLKIVLFSLEETFKSLKKFGLCIGLLWQVKRVGKKVYLISLSLYK